MFKRLSGMLILSVALLFSGVFNSSVDAASESNDRKDDAYQTFYQVTNQWDQSSFYSIFKKIKYSLYNYEWQVDQPKQPEQEEQPSKTPESEQSESEQPKHEAPEQNEPKEQAPEEPKENNQVPEQPAEPAPTPPQNTGQDQAQNEGQMDQLSEFEQQVVELTNNERTRAGLAPLKADQELSRVARHKSQDMADVNYFDHNSPTYGSPFDMMQAYGINYRTAGENIAKGQRSPQEVVNAWMNSPGHRENIMNGNFTHIGVGFVESGNHWTQMFIGK